MPSVTFDYSSLQQHEENCSTETEIEDTSARSIENSTQPFATMKYEINRLNSYKNKWPLSFIQPEDLAEAGFFYLRLHDKVQCAFCHIIIYNWTVNDKPIREHMRNSPNCPLLSRRESGNIPIFRQASSNPSRICFEQKRLSRESYRRRLADENNHTQRRQESENVVIKREESYQPKHPRLADISKRLRTYEEWPLFETLSPTYLSKCGFFYTGVSDVVTCFFCGGSVGNWELDDNPLKEHEKYFPHCAFLPLARSAVSSSEAAPLYKKEMIDEVCRIFPKSLVLEVVSKHSEENPFKSTEELCEEILDYQSTLNGPGVDTISRYEQPLSTAAAATTILETENQSSGIFVCKICMDQEMAVVFLPCGHLVACLQCSEDVINCPLCRKPIRDRLRTYVS